MGKENKGKTNDSAVEMERFRNATRALLNVTKEEVREQEFKNRHKAKSGKKSK